MMKSTAAFQLPSRWLIVYIIAVSTVRGAFIPDFRYGYISILIIQIIYPIALLLPLLFLRPKRIGYLFYWVIGIAGIVLSELLGSEIYKAYAGIKAFEDSETQAVLFVSVTALIVFFSVMLVVVGVIRAVIAYFKR